MKVPVLMAQGYGPTRKPLVGGIIDGVIHALQSSH